jgi:hypothetical protein
MNKLDHSVKFNQDANVQVIIIMKTINTKSISALPFKINIEI